MTEPPKKVGRAASGVGTDLGVVEEAAQSMRRMQANEEFDAEGIRTIWHRGRNRVEMLSWENRDNVIVRQELSIFGMVIDFRQGHGLRTGNLPLDDESEVGGRPIGKTVKFTPRLADNILDYAAHLLKHIRNRDFYAQHMLKEVHDAITQSGFDDMRTGVATLKNFSRDSKPLPTLSMQAPATGFVAQHGRLLLIVALCAIAGCGGGLLLGFFLGIF